jgi:hypothetical protein
VIQCGCCLRFAPKAFQGNGVVEHIAR